MSFFFGFCVIRLPRLSTRCRGAPRRRGELRKVWDLAVSLILRSVSEDSAGKGHSDSVVPPAGC